MNQSEVPRASFLTSLHRAAHPNPPRLQGTQAVPMGQPPCLAQPGLPRMVGHATAVGGGGPQHRQGWRSRGSRRSSGGSRGSRGRGVVSAGDQGVAGRLFRLCGTAGGRRQATDFGDQFVFRPQSSIVQFKPGQFTGANGRSHAFDRGGNGGGSPHLHVLHHRIEWGGGGIFCHGGSGGGGERGAGGSGEGRGSGRSGEGSGEGSGSGRSVWFSDRRRRGGPLFLVPKVGAPLVAFFPFFSHPSEGGLLGPFTLLACFFLCRHRFSFGFFLFPPFPPHPFSYPDLSTTPSTHHFFVVRRGRQVLAVLFVQLPFQGKGSWSTGSAQGGGGRCPSGITPLLLYG